MANKGSMLSKTLVIGIIFLFAVMSIIPSVAVDTVNIEHANGKCSSDDIDWWPMFHHDLNNTGYSLSPYTPQTNNILWTYTTGFFVICSPAVVNGRVYIGSDDEFFYCLNADTGEEIWLNSIPGGTSASSPCIVDGRVYVGTTYDHFFCWDADTGEEIWSFYKGYGLCLSPSLSNNKVYIPFIRDNYKPKICCLDADTGAEIWNRTFTDGAIGHIAIYEGRVYILHYFGVLYCLDGETGDIIWEKMTGGKHAAPAITNGKVYASADGIRCLYADTGEEIWHYEGEWSYCSPAVAYDKVYYVSSDGKVLCLDADTGDELWAYIIGSDYEHAFSSPAVADGKVYVGIWSNGMLLCLDADSGEFIWDYSVSGPEWLFSSPAVADGRLYIGGGFKIYCFEDFSMPPSEPSIDGPTSGDPGVEYNYTFVSTDSDGDDVFYLIDWGDGTVEDWSGSYPSGQIVEISHEWSGEGVYGIRAKARDTHGDESNWSAPYEVVIGNEPPNAPTIIGQTSGKTGQEYEYTFNATDPNGDDVKYYIDWGDNNTEETGFNPSGTEVMVKHKWTEDGTYNITAIAEDINGAQGPEGKLTVNIPRTRATTNVWIQWFVERFPLLERLLTLIRAV